MARLRRVCDSDVLGQDCFLRIGRGFLGQGDEDVMHLLIFGITARSPYAPSC